jgi:predicted small lipoprotein YifL
MKIINLLFLILLLSSCGDVGKVLRNEKIKNTDEFLIKKKGPLVLPPNYEVVPEPDTIKKKVENEENKIKNILKNPKNVKKNSNSSSTLEKAILEKIN